MPSMTASLRPVILATIAAAGAIACGGTEDGPDPTPTFADGLAAEQIMEKANEAGESVESLRVVQTEESKFLGEESRSKTETILVGEDVYMKITDEDGASELLQYRGRTYTRASEGDPWVPDPDLEGVTAAVSAAREFASEALIDPSFDLVRLPGETADGQEYYRVSAGLATRLEGDVVLEPFSDLIDISKRLPEQLIPDEAAVRLDFWIAVDDFNLHRWSLESTLYRDGEATFSSRRSAQASDFNEPLDLPGPLPQG